MCRWGKQTRWRRIKVHVGCERNGQRTVAAAMACCTFDADAGPSSTSSTSFFFRLLLHATSLPTLPRPPSILLLLADLADSPLASLCRLSAAIPGRSGDASLALLVPPLCGDCPSPAGTHAGCLSTLCAADKGLSGEGDMPGTPLTLPFVTRPNNGPCYPAY